MSNASSTERAKAIAAAFKQLSGTQKIRLQRRLGATAVAEAEKGVRLGRDPYGNKWAPLTSRTGLPLRRTGNNIQRNWNAQTLSPTRFVFGSGFRWIKTHQYGAVIRPKRARALRFWVEGASAVQSFKEGSFKIKKGQATQMTLVFARKVVIPRRQLVPEVSTGGIGKIWFKAFERTTNAYVKQLMSGQDRGVG